MTDLSPQAQAVKKSADDAYWLWDQMCPADAKIIAVAVLRVLADEVVPEETEAPKAVFDCEPTPAWRPMGR